MGTPLAHPKYRRDIDGLRAVAVLAVLAFHAFPTVATGGFVGVDVFFVISGFLISSIVFGSLEADRFSYVEFYARRIRRIFPALIIVLVACYVSGWFLLFPEEYRELGKHTAAGAGFLANVSFFMERGYFDSSAQLKPLLHLWSLGVEEQFYIFWPLLLGLVWKSRRGLLGTTLLIAFASFALNVYTVTHDTDAAFYLPYTRFWELMIGGILAYLRLHHRERVPGGTWRSVAGGILIVASIVLLDKKALFPGWWALMPTLGTFLVISAPRDAWLNRQILGSRVLVGIGLISYPLYLWHWPLLSFARIVEGHVPPLHVRLAALCCSFPLAWITYRFVETPIRRGQTRTTVYALGATMVVMALVGTVTFAEHGLTSRALARRVPSTGGVESVSRYSDGSCERLLGLREVKEEVCLANDAAPDILIVGDSHAIALNSAAYFHAVPLKTVLVAGLACPPYPNVDFVPREATNYGHDCQKIAESALRAASAIRSLTTVVIATHFADLGRFRYFASPERPLSEQQAFLAGNEYLIDQLLAMRKRVVYVIDVPLLTVRPPNCVPRPFNSDPPSCNLPMSAAMARQREYRSWVLQLSRDIPQLKLYDSFQAMCVAGSCLAGDSRESFYEDSDHLSLFGSRRVLSDMRRYLSSGALLQVTAGASGKYIKRAPNDSIATHRSL